ncbi:MAG: DUF6607 family protein [Pseudomonadota bacterium]
MNSLVFRRDLLRIVTVFSLLIGPPTTVADQSQAEQRRYTYSWLFTDGTDMKPRGGTTKGAAITLAGTGKQWQALQNEKRAGFNKDRLAILSLAGQYRATFDFIETVGFTDGYRPGKPYQTWGTELVKVIEDSPKFISLQHILVMYFMRDDGSKSEPVVMKHWRQDWTYEDRDLHVYQGDQQWKHQRISRSAAKGNWTQTVFQVDDSPRYEAYGRWVHTSNNSHWRSSLTARPLPRREFSVRSDYSVLEAVNRITITPTGWVMEEDNLKTKLLENGHREYLAREAGITRYERIEDKLEAGNNYWVRTQDYWAAVRSAWSDVYQQHRRFAVSKSSNDKPLFQLMFENADEYTKLDNDNQRSSHIDETVRELHQYVKHRF